MEANLAISGLHACVCAAHEHAEIGLLDPEWTERLSPTSFLQPGHANLDAVNTCLTAVHINQS